MDELLEITAELRRATEAMKEAEKVLKESRYSIMSKVRTNEDLMKAMDKANQVHVEPLDNECLGSFQ